MKKLYTTLFAVALTSSAFAQQLPNNGFENWSASKGNPAAFNPAGYNTSNQCYEITASITNASEYCINNVEKTTDQNGGLAAAKLTVGDPVDKNASSVITNTDFPMTKNPAPTGLDFKSRPVSFTAYVKFAPIKGDEGSLTIVLYDGDKSIGGVDVTITKADSKYYKVEGSFDYDPTTKVIPNAFVLLISAGESAGTVLFVDDINLAYLTTSNYSAVSPVKLFTDVQAGNLHFSENVEQVSFIDMNGRTAQSSTGSAEDFSTAGMNPGMYIVRYNYNSNTYVGKVVIQ